MTCLARLRRQVCALTHAHTLHQPPCTGKRVRVGSSPTIKGTCRRHAASRAMRLQRSSAQLWPHAVSRRRLDPPIAPGTRINVVVRGDSSAAAYSFSQWLQAASNRTWALGVNKTLPSFPGATVVSGGSAVTSFIGSTPFSIG